jgi:hypothetical protein
MLRDVSKKLDQLKKDLDASDARATIAIEKGSTPDLKQKPSNPKDILGSTRAPLSMVSAAGQVEESLAMYEGAVKYGKWNYRAIGVRVSVYLDAALRHLMRYNNGEDRDPKTGVHHLGYARACMGIILDALNMGKLTDDRPPMSPATVALLDAAEARVKHLQQMFAGNDPTHYTIWDTEQPESRPQRAAEQTQKVPSPVAQRLAQRNITEDEVDKLLAQLREAAAAKAKQQLRKENPCPYYGREFGHCILMEGHLGMHINSGDGGAFNDTNDGYGHGV